MLPPTARPTATIWIRSYSVASGFERFSFSISSGSTSAALAMLSSIFIVNIFSSASLAVFFSPCSLFIASAPFLRISRAFSGSIILNEMRFSRFFHPFCDPFGSCSPSSIFLYWLFSFSAGFPSFFPAFIPSLVIFSNRKSAPALS